jgi:hypothetical protein
MKKLLQSLCIAFALCLPAVALTSCAWLSTPTAQKKAVTTLFSTHTAVDAAYQGYLRAVISGNAKTNSMPEVAAAYVEFQNAFNIAIALSASNTNAPAPTAVLSALENFTIVLNESTRK